jgi:acyl carrier protein
MANRIAAVDLVARALERGGAEIPSEGTVENVPGWDSLGHVKIIMTLESELGRMLKPEEIASLRGVADVDRILSAGKSS